MLDRIALVVAAAVSVAAHAAEPVVGVHLGTYHFDRAAGFREFNPGVYVALPDRGLTAGVYKNSEGGTSAYGGVTLRHVLGPIDLTLGAVTGYRRASVLPLVVPSVLVPNTRARLSLLPPADKRGGAVHLSLEF